MKKQVVLYVEKYKHITTINELIFPVCQYAQYSYPQ